MAVPRTVCAYVDPGTGTMLWQVAAAAVIGALFYVKRVATWIRSHFGLRSQRASGFAFASVFALFAAPLTITLVHGYAFPRFNDLLLIGIVLTAYLFTWEPAVFLLVISVLVSAWVLPPYGSMRIEGAAQWCRLISFTSLSVFLVCLITRMKARRGASAARRSAFSMHQMAAVK
jgi:hypothetical protein